MNLVNPQTALHGSMDERGHLQKLSADVTLKRGNAIVHGAANTASDSWTITLPPVTEAAGMFVYIYATIANSKTITVQDNYDDAGLTDITLDGDTEYVGLFSDGERWQEWMTGYA